MKNNEIASTCVKTGPNLVVWKEEKKGGVNFGVKKNCSYIRENNELFLCNSDLNLTRTALQDTN